MNNNQESKINNHSKFTKTMPTNYIFNMNPQKYENCKKIIYDLKCFFMIESVLYSNYHYVAINKEYNKLYEIHTYVVGFEGAYKYTTEVLDFVFQPRELSIADFLELVDSKFPGMSILYDGINENNLHLYKELLKDSYAQRTITSNKSINIENRILKCVFNHAKIPYEYSLYGSKAIYPLVSVAEFLMNKGFKFEIAYVGGGITEISHTGSLSYDASYYNLEEFKNNFDKDINLAHEKTEREYCGWATIDYRYISVSLRKDSLKVRIDNNDKHNEFIIMEWYNCDKYYNEFIDEAKNKIQEMIGNDVELTQYYRL